MRSLYLTTNTIDQSFGQNNSSSLWVPIPDASYQSFVDRLFRKFESLIFGQADEIFDVVLIDYTFAIFVAQHLHLNAVRNACVDEKVELIADNHFDSLLFPNWKELACWYDKGIKDTNRTREWLRSKYYTFQYNGLGVSRTIRESLGRNQIFSIGKNDWLKEEFVNKFNVGFFHQMEPHLWLCGLEPTANSSIDYRELIVEPLLGYLKDTDELFLRGADTTSISDVWVSRLRSVEAIYTALRGKKKKPSKLLVTGGTNPFRKAMVLAFQRENVDVNVFHHGNDIGARILEHVHRAEVSHCKKFVCPTHQIARNYEGCYHLLPTEIRTQTAYSYVGTDYYKRLVDNAQSVPSVGHNRSRRFMIVGRPLNNLRLLDACGAFYLHKIDLEYQLINGLGKLTNQLMYKMHPEWSAVARSLYSKCDCSLIDGNFEQVWQSADVFIFTSATTTTFEYSLCTNRPVVLFDAKGNKWQQDVKTKLVHRCEIVEYDVDSYGKAILDQDEIENAIVQAAIKKLDRSFVESFMW